MKECIAIQGQCLQYMASIAHPRDKSCNTVTAVQMMAEQLEKSTGKKVLCFNCSIRLHQRTLTSQGLFKPWDPKQEFKPCDPQKPGGG
jgi:hypothetical protein